MSGNSTAIYSCTEDELQQVTELVGSAATAGVICTTYDCSISAAGCVLQYLSAQTAVLTEEMADTASSEVAIGLDVMFIIFSAMIVFMMQLGFALLCAGSIRSKNCMQVLLKNILDACVGAIGYYLLGFAFAFGHRLNESSNVFIGDWNFALSYTTQISKDDSNALYDGFVGMGWQMWFFQFSFCAAATTIVSGAVAERCTFGAYLAYSFFISAFVYPVVSHWVWSPDGWLSAFNTSQNGYALILKTGAVDFSGAGVVHMTGGMAALLGAWVIGPRIGRFDASGKVNEMKGHSATLVVMGTFLLWFGFYGFNPGSNLAISTLSAATVVSRICVTTTLSAASGGLVALFYRYARTSSWDTVLVCNGALAGLVSVTAGCAVVEPWAAIICGGVGALVFIGADHLLLNILKVDDPVSAWPLHGACGFWGLMFPGLLAAPDYMLQVYGDYGLGETLKDGKRYGVFYGGHGQVLLCQFIEACSITAWVAILMGAFFYAFKAARLLRVSVETELAGLDVSKHGGGGAAGGGGGYGAAGGGGGKSEVHADEDGAPVLAGGRVSPHMQ